MEPIRPDLDLNLVWDPAAPKPTERPITGDEYVAWLEEIGALGNPSMESDDFKEMFAL